MSEKPKAVQTGAEIVHIEGPTLPVTNETIKEFICPRANVQELNLFVNICRLYQLNPFKREAYLIKYGEEPARTVVGYEVYLKRAERTGKWAGLETGHEADENGAPIKAWARVFRKDWGDRSLYHEVYHSEYVQRKKYEGKMVPTKFWREKPITMLKKVAMAQAFRTAFPDELGGLPYIEEELMDTGEREEQSQAELKLEEARVEAYKALQEKPVKRVRDEFDPEAPDPGDPDSSFEVDAKVPTEAQLAAFRSLLEDLEKLGVTPTTIWNGIDKFYIKNFGIPAVDTGMFTEETIEKVLGYLHRWKKALEAEIKAKEQPEKKGGSRAKKSQK